MQIKVLNVTNGDYFNKYFLSKYGGEAVPFCEAMMDGETVANIYSQQFVELRARSLNVTENEYRSKMYVYDAMKNNDYQTLRLWFGKDTFCQMNLLTLLAYLEQIDYKGEVKLNYIDDETFEVIEADIEVQLGVYRKIYEDVLMLRQVPADAGVLSVRAMELFLDYHSKDGELVKLVRENAHKEKRELIALLLEQTKEYGLSDLQVERLIDSNR